MLDVLDERSIQTFDARTWLGAQTSLVDVMALLTAGVTHEWEVMQEIDPVGEISVIVMPALDGPAKPCFLLYEKNGHAQVATIRDDCWESDSTFASSAEAVAAIVAATASSR